MGDKFETSINGDAIVYWYNVTQHIQKFFGDVIEKACIVVGQVYNDDSEDEIERMKNIFELNAKEIEKRFVNNKNLFIHLPYDLKLTLSNHKVLVISSIDGFEIENA